MALAMAAVIASRVTSSTHVLRRIRCWSESMPLLSVDEPPSMWVYTNPSIPGWAVRIRKLAGASWLAVLGGNPKFVVYPPYSVNKPPWYGSPKVCDDMLDALAVAQASLELRRVRC